MVSSRRVVATGAGSDPLRGGSEIVRGRELPVEDRCRSHFVPVVIFGVDPEDRHRRHLVLAGNLVGQLQRGQRLEQREQRAAKETRLLAGDDRDGRGVG